MVTTHFKLKKFDMNKTKGTKPKDGKICVFIAQRNSGKSYAIRDLLFHHKDVPLCQVISASERVNPFYSEFVAPAFIETEYSPEILSRFLERQRFVCERKEHDPKFSKFDARGILVMDDLMFQAKTWVRDENVRQIFMNGRHLDILYILSLQYSIGLEVACRANIDFVFLFREPKRLYRQKLYENYASIIPTFELFCDLMDVATEDFGCLVIDNGAKSNKWEDCVFHFKAKERKFKIGTEKAWNVKKQVKKENTVSKKFSIKLI